MELTKLSNMLENSWDKNTSACPDLWTTNNPARGQCVVTSLIVQDMYGGDILVTKTDLGESHFYNRLPNGTVLDLTRKQYPLCKEFSTPRKRRRNDLLRWKSVMERYKLLKVRMGL